MKRADLCVRSNSERALYRTLLAIVMIGSLSGLGLAQELATIRLNEPSKKRGLPFMEALWVKASAQEWSDKELSLEDLSDLVWAANGINRPDVRKYTASSAMNAHDVDLYLFMKEGIYLYDADKHELKPILPGDFRSQILRTPPPRPKDAGGPPHPAPSNPPIQIILISDFSRFRAGTQEQKYEWGAIDAGIVSQNISLFCAATGLKTRPRASMDKEVIKKLLNLKDTQYVFLDHPIGYAK